tara:strand:+ start:134 stop:547 length:414 start_codon:yes stop_codon:yes gene_type:complete
MNIIKILPLINAGIIIGITLFQSLLIAPGINKLVSTKDASIFLRFIWPNYFITIAIVSLISLLIIFFYNNSQTMPKYFFMISLLLMVVCYIVTPFINEARDASNDFLFSSLHLLTVVFTLLTLVFNILVIVYWKFHD